MPTVPLADVGGAERTVSEGLAAIYTRSATGEGSYREVGLANVAMDFGRPAQFQLTSPGAFLGGGMPQYALYTAKDGDVALAALEPHFLRRLVDHLELTVDDRGVPTAEELEAIFLGRTAAEWEHWAKQRDIPLAAVRRAGGVQK